MDQRGEPERLPLTRHQVFNFRPQQARCLKIEGSRLRPNPTDGNLYRMQLAEIEVYIRNPTGAQNSTVNAALGAPIAASSSFEYAGWSRDDINDGQWDSLATSIGWSSDDNTRLDHSEWIGLDLGSSYLVQRVILYPRNDEYAVGQGFPINFTIQVSNEVNCFR